MTATSGPLATWSCAFLVHCAWSHLPAAAVESSYFLNSIV